MSSVNKVILVGRLGQDPEVKHTPSGATVANFSIATKEEWKDKAGAKQEKTEWHRIVVWGKQAELAGEYLSKGKQIYLEGKLDTRKWQAQDGSDRYTTEVKASNITFLSPKSENAGHSHQGAADPTEPTGQPVVIEDGALPF